MNVGLPAPCTGTTLLPMVLTRLLMSKLKSVIWNAPL